MGNLNELYNQAEQLSEITESLSLLAGTIREAFAHQRKQSLDDIAAQHQALSEEIAFDAAMADEQMTGKSLGDKEPFIHYENILTHLQAMANSFRQLADELRTQMQDKVLLFDKDTDEIHTLLERQELILRTLHETVSLRDSERLKEVVSECKELLDTCENIAASYESRLADGLCLPDAAPAMLSTLGMIKALARNEDRTAILLSRWIWDNSSDRPDENVV